jgi:hypothetical protein
MNQHVSREYNGAFNYIGPNYRANTADLIYLYPLEPSCCYVYQQMWCSKILCWAHVMCLRDLCEPQIKQRLFL